MRIFCFRFVLQHILEVREKLFSLATSLTLVFSLFFSFCSVSPVNSAWTHVCLFEREKKSKFAAKTSPSQQKSWKFAKKNITFAVEIVEIDTHE